MDRPVTTLYMLMSVDGKISTGSTDDMDVDKDFPDADDASAAASGAGVGYFVVLDNRHLTESGVRYFCALSKEFVLVTTNASHPAYKVEADNLHIIHQRKLCLAEVLATLKNEFGCDRITIQSGGTLNAMFLREKLFDYIDIVVAPVLIGGRETSTLIDGDSLRTENELDKLGALELVDCTALKDSYIRLRYKVI